MWDTGWFGGTVAGDRPPAAADGPRATTLLGVVEPACGRICLHGELDFSTAPAVVDLVRGIDAPGDVVVDLSGLTFLDASGLHVLAGLAESRRGTGRVVLCGPRGIVRRVLEIVGLDATDGVEIRT